MGLLNSFSNASARGTGLGLGASAGPPLFTFTVGTLFPFSTGGVGGTNGTSSDPGVTTGPTLSQVVATYSAITWPWVTNTAYFNMRSYQGYQQFTVPVTGTYAIVCSGASGGAGPGTSPGIGAVASGIFSLVQGQILTFVIGQKGGVGAFGGQGAPGGGGTFVFTSSGTFSTATCLIAAGGGGGTGTNGYSVGISNASITTTGGSCYGGTYTGGVGGAGGNGGTGNDGQAGAGITSGPPLNPGGTAPLAISAGGVGGFCTYSAYGGFGGGGGYWGGGGGGGGYSGGADGYWSPGTSAGGGGSFVAAGATSSGIAQSGQVYYNGAASIQRIS
jgi:hypothetical protein